MVEKKQIQKGSTTVSSSPDKIIPKFCTSINFGVLESGHVVMSFSYNEDPTQPHSLIERIIIDYPHAKRIIEVLTTLVEKVDKGDDAS